MKRTVVALVLAVLAAAVCQLPAYAWHAKGHMAVAALAYQLLMPTVRTRVDTLLAKNPSFDEWKQRVASAPAEERSRLVFALASVWPDDIKNDPNYTETNDFVTGSRAARNTGYKDKLRHKYWHFVDQPFSDDGSALPALAAVNAEERIVLFRDTLASNASDNVKSYDLVWLEHLVGDVHQPLHCVTRVSATLPKGDRGGNGTILTPACDQCATELHGFWDGVVGESKRATVAAAFAATLDPAAAAAAADMDVSHWTRDSFALARTRAYVDPPIGPKKGPFTVIAPYRTAALATAKDQIALAGVRLANLINANLK